MPLERPCIMFILNNVCHVLDLIVMPLERPCIMFILNNVCHVLDLIVMPLERPCSGILFILMMYVMC